MSTSAAVCEEPEGLSPSRTAAKKKRSLPGHPDPNAEVIALSPRSLLATNRFICEVCNKGFQRDQNLQLHRRGHNLPWRLKQKPSHEIRRKVYICPEPTCVHHDPTRALGDLTGIKKHFSRKHGEKNWKCDKCSKRYAVQSDWKAHQKTCGTREYHCDCGSVFSRRDSFITHRAYCDALAEESGKISTQIWPSEDQGMPPLSGQHQQISFMTGGDRRVPSSPSSQIIKDASLYSDFCKPPDRMASDCDSWSQDGSKREPCTSNEGSSVRSEMLYASQKSQLTTSKTTKPGLSLSLGMSPGPGPPCSISDGSGSLQFPTLETLHKLPLPYSNYDSLRTLPSIDAVSSPHAPFSSPKRACTRWDSANAASSDLGSVVLMTELDMSATQLHMSQSPRLSVSVSRVLSAQETRQIGSYHHTAASSATALLQKAAQMGATASKPTLLQKFGMKIGDKQDAQEISKEFSSWATSSCTYSSPTSRPWQVAGFAGHDNVVASYEGERHHTGSAYVADDMMTKEPLTYQNPSTFHASLPLTLRVASAGSSSSSISVEPQLTTAAEIREHKGHTTMVDFLGVGESSTMVGLFSNRKKEDGQGLSYQIDEQF